jgi:hypothetical protein
MRRLFFDKSVGGTKVSDITSSMGNSTCALKIRLHRAPIFEILASTPNIDAVANSKKHVAEHKILKGLHRGGIWFLFQSRGRGKRN